MSESDNNQGNPAITGMLQFGQAMAQNFFQTIARQHAVMQDSSGEAAPGVALPETEAFARCSRISLRVTLRCGRRCCN